MVYCNNAIRWSWQYIKMSCYYGNGYGLAWLQKCLAVVHDIIIVQDYITVKEKGSVFLPHTAGRYAAKRFRKAHVSTKKGDCPSWSRNL